MPESPPYGPVTSYDQVPGALNYLIIQVNRLNDALAEKAVNQPAVDQWFNLEQFCSYHPSHPAQTTVYGWISRREVPHKKDGKHIFFLKSEIDEWLKGKKRKSSAELEQEDAEMRKQRSRRGGRVPA